MVFLRSGFPQWSRPSENPYPAIRGEDDDNDKLFNSANLEIAFHYHDSFDEMISHRPFNDRPAELRENESEGLNRPAFIRIGAIGACELEG